MLDTLVLHIPMRAEFVKTLGNLNSIVADVDFWQVRAASSSISRNRDGDIVASDMYHPFEKLPSSFGTMAMKFYSTNVANTRPYVALNASVKILQGHNICGGESVKNLACEMLGLFMDTYPFLWGGLDVQNTTISRIDSTFSARVDNPVIIQPCLNFMSNISNGHRRNDKDKRDFFNTVYWGGATSRLGGAKVYGKHREVMETVDKLRENADKGILSAKEKLAVYTPDLLQFSESILRFESSTKRRKLEALNVPTNLWQFIRHQGMDKHILTRLWRLWFDPIFAAMIGDIHLERLNDSEVLDLCRARLWTQRRKKGTPLLIQYQVFPICALSDFTVRGTISYSRANRVFTFFQSIRSNGFLTMRSRMAVSTFNDNVSYLISLGYSRSVLQNLHVGTIESVSFADLVKIDFTNQVPPCYNYTVSAYIDDFDSYIRNSSNIEYNGGIKI